MWRNIDLRLGHFVPGFLVPLDAYPTVGAGFALLFLLNFSLTYTQLPSGVPCTLLRLTLAPFAIRFFWQFGYGDFYTAPANQVYVGMATVGLYGIMRVIDTSLVTLVEAGPPRWVRTDTGEALPIPQTLVERLVYALDYSTSLRGTSWSRNRHWDWAPKSLVRSPSEPIHRGAFVRRALRQLIAQYMLVDILDSFNKSIPWSSSPSPQNPITTLPVLLQLLFSFSVCLGTLLAIVITHNIVAVVAVTLGSPPEAWPPMFDAPLGARSLADFWGRRWHMIFRRVFARLSLLVLVLVPAKHARLRVVLRALVVFALSATLHILIMYRLELLHPNPDGLALAFSDRSILAFFLGQPLGLALEALVVQPLARSLCRGNEHYSAEISRVWTWTFMLWAGRFWSDVWVRRGLWEPRELVIGYSLVRGLLVGQWKA